MNLKWKNIYLAYLGSGGLLAYTTIYFIKQNSLIDKTCLKPAGFVPNKFTMDEADINIKLKLNNKSAINYYLYNQKYDVYINGNLISKVANPNKIYVTAEKITDIWLNVKFNPTQVAHLSWQTLKDILLKNSDATVRIKGSAKAKVLSGLFVFPYPIDETFKLKDLKDSSDEPC